MNIRMHPRRRTASVIFTGVALAGVTLATSLARNDAPPTRSFEDLKALAGEWVRCDETGAPTEEIVTSFRVTAGGSAVLETVFAGTDHEMVTLYHEDGEELVLTHYCVAGNQPHMVADRNGEKDQLVFRCTGVSNADSEAEAHMHRAELNWLGPDRIHSRWLMFTAGEITYTADFQLARR